MKVLACDTSWTITSGVPSCPGTLHEVQADQIPSGINLEDAQILVDHALGLFAIVAGFLLLQRAIR